MPPFNKDVDLNKWIGPLAVFMVNSEYVYCVFHRIIMYNVCTSIFNKKCHGIFSVNRVTDKYDNFKIYVVSSLDPNRS